MSFFPPSHRRISSSSSSLSSHFRRNNSIEDLLCKNLIQRKEIFVARYSITKGNSSATGSGQNILLYRPPISKEYIRTRGDRETKQRSHISFICIYIFSSFFVTIIPNSGPCISTFLPLLFQFSPIFGKLLSPGRVSAQQRKSCCAKIKLDRCVNSDVTIYIGRK